jgi:hypothetical protein
MAMPKSSTSRLHLVAQVSGPGGKSPGSPIRRFRLARLQLDARPHEPAQPRRTV